MLIVSRFFTLALIAGAAFGTASALAQDEHEAAPTLSLPAPSLDTQAQTPTEPQPAPATDTASGAIRLVVTLNWEGRTLAPHNLTAIKAFRRKFRDLQFVHFVSPAYFTHPGADAEATRVAIRSTMRAGDKLGVTIGGWKSVADTAGVIFRNGPTFWGETLRPIDCSEDCGNDVPINIYPATDLDRIVKTSLDTLAANGFGRPEAAMATGWLASQQVLESFAANGIHYDFSGVAPELLSRRIAGFPLYQWVRGLWSQVTPHTQPFVLPSLQTSLTEVPQSLAAIDYIMEKDVAAIFAEYLERLRREPSRDLTFQLAFHQESAYQKLPVLARALQNVFGQAASAKVSLRPLDIVGMNLPNDERYPEQKALPPPLVGPPTPAETMTPVAH